jgi:uncharacterized membrane protein
MNSKRTLKAAGIATAIVFFAAAAYLTRSEAKPDAGAEKQEVTVVGTNYCVGCALKKEHGAAAQCSVYGHRHGLKVEKALDAQGQELAALKGRTLNYLENDKSTKLAKGEVFHGARVKVKGQLYESASTIEVAEFQEP